MSIADEQRVSASGATTTQSASQPDAYSPQVIRKLNDLTSDFYAREATSFSATRQAPWHGWEKAWELIAAPDAAQGPFPSHAAVRDSLSSRAARIPDDFASNSKDSLAVLDLGCGNLRFERFLAERTNAPLRVTALDNCPDLASPEIGALSAAFPHSLRSSSAASKTKEEDASGQGANPPEKTIVDLRALDIVESLLDGTFADRLPRNSHDLAVAFGLMHHLPTFALRARVLEGLLGLPATRRLCRRVVLAVPERPAPGCQSRHGHRRGPRRPSPPHLPRKRLSPRLAACRGRLPLLPPHARGRNRRPSRRHPRTQRALHQRLRAPRSPPLPRGHPLLR